MFILLGTPKGERITSTGRAVLHEGHVLLWHYLGDHSLVAVAPCKLVALGDLALLGNEHPDHLVYAWLQLVACVPRKALDVYDDAALPVGDLER